MMIPIALNTKTVDGMPPYYPMARAIAGGLGVLDRGQPAVPADDLRDPGRPAYRYRPPRASRPGRAGRWQGRQCRDRGRIARGVTESCPAGVSRAGRSGWTDAWAISRPGGRACAGRRSTRRWRCPGWSGKIEQHPGNAIAPPALDRLHVVTQGHEVGVRGLAQRGFDQAADRARGQRRVQGVSGEAMNAATILSGWPPAIAQPSAPSRPVASTHCTIRSEPTSRPPCQNPHAKPPIRNTDSAR